MFEVGLRWVWYGGTHVYPTQIGSSSPSGAMALRGIPPVATFSTKGMDKCVSLEITFEKLDNNKDITGMWNLITTKTPDFSKWPGDVAGWILAPHAAPLAQHVRLCPTGWFESIGDLGESFACLIKLVGEHVKITGLKNNTDLNGKPARKGDVFVKNGQLGVCVTLDDGRSLMVKPANLESMV